MPEGLSAEEGHQEDEGTCLDHALEPLQQPSAVEALEMADHQAALEPSAKQVATNDRDFTKYSKLPSDVSQDSTSLHDEDPAPVTNGNGKANDVTEEARETKSVQKAKVDENVKPVAPDGGYGWLILLAAHCTLIFREGIAKGLGIFLPTFRLYFEVPTALIGWVSSLCVTFADLTGIISGPLCRKLGCRPVAMMGGFFGGLGLILASCSTRLVHLSLSLSLSGIGLGLSLTPSLTMVGHYFDKRYSIANGLSYAGSGVGILVLAPLAQVFIDTYGWRGGLLLLGALCFHVAVCGAMLRPVGSTSRTTRGKNKLTYKQCSTSDTDYTGHDDLTSGKNINGNARITDDSCQSSFEKTVETTIVELEDLGTKVNHTKPEQIGNSATNNHDAAPGQVENGLCNVGGEKTQYDLQNMDTADVIQIESIRDDDNINRNNRNGNYNAGRRSSNDPESLAVADLDQQTKQCDGEDDEDTISEEDKKDEKSCVSLLGLSLFKDVSFLILMTVQFCGRFTYMGWLIYLVPHAQEKGVAPMQAAFVASVAGVSNIVARASHGLVVDYNIMTAAQLLTLASFGSALPMLLDPLLNTYGLLIAGSLSYGLASGVFFPIAVVVIKQTIGMERFPNALGWSYGFAGIGRMSAGFLTGWLFDQFGNYNASFIMLGLIQSFASALLIIFLCMTRKKKDSHKSA